jgi:uncharacterized membrane protein
MNELNNYSTRVRQALNRRYETLSRSEQDDILAEIQSHIEEGLEDRRMGAGEAERSAKVLAELGSPTEMAGAASSARKSYPWLLSFLIPPAIRFLIDFMGWEISIPDPLYIPIVMIFPLYLLLLLLVLYRQAAIERDASSNKPTKNVL